MTGRADFEKRRVKRTAGLKRAAERAQAEAAQEYQTGHDMAQVIPFGQPILVGHYSEGRDRRYRSKIESHFRKSAEFQDKAQYYENRAKAAERNNAIFSDDPKAAEMLEDKIARLKEQQELMKLANKFVRANDLEGLLDLGFSPARAHTLLTGEGDICHSKGFPTWMLTNNNANIRRLEERLKELRDHENDQTQEWEYPELGIKIVDNVEDNRIQIFFPGKPAEAIRKALKYHGFHWAPSVPGQPWQRLRNSSALYWAKNIVEGNI